MIQENGVNEGTNKKPEDIEVEVIVASAADTAQEETETEIEAGAEQTDESTAEKTTEKEQVTIEFPYSELLRAKAPKAFEVAEKVATDWKNEGDFTDLGITHPMAGIVASQALLKAKDVEKKLEEKGVFTMAKMGLEIAKSQVENIKSKIK